MKSVITISIDTDVLLKMKEKNLSPSEIANEYFRQVVENLDLLSSKEKSIDAEIDQLNRIKAELKKVEEKEKEKKQKRLNEFLNLSDKVIDNKPALIYWSKELGYTVEELADLKRKQSKTSLNL